MTLTARPRLLIRFAVLAALALCGIVLALSSTGTPPVGAQDGSLPAKPTGVVATATHDSVALAWDDPGDASITHYQIFRRDRDVHDAGEFVTIQENTGSAAASYTDDTVEPEKRYVYRVKAVNQHGASTWSDFVRADTPAAPDPADLAPSGLEVSLVENRVTLTWDAPASDAASVTGYEILRRRPNDGEAALTTLVADTGNAETGYTDDTANEPGVRYTYRVRALRDGGQSKVSNYARIDLPDDYAQDSSGSDEPTPTAEALAPSGLTAEDAKDGGVALSWTAPAEDAGSVTGYEVLRAQGSAALTTLAADTGNTDTAYTDSGVTGDLDDYRYQVKALRGGDASQGSNVAGVLQSAHAGAIVPLADVTLVSNTGQPEGSTTAVVYEMAQGFQTGTNTGGYSLSEIVVGINTTGSGTARVTLYSSSTTDPATAEPSASLAVMTDVTYTSGTTDFVSFTAPANTTLSASTIYFVVLEEESGAAGLRVRRTSPDEFGEDADAAAGWSITDRRLFKSTIDGNWSASNRIMMIQVKGDASTVPLADVTLISNLGKFRNDGGNFTNDQAQAFTTGSNSGGYSLTKVVIASSLNASANFTVSVHENDSGAPGTSLGTLTNPTLPATGEAGNYEFTHSGIDLVASTTYFIVVDVSTSSSFNIIHNTDSDAEDTGGATGWSIGDSSLYRGFGSTGSWTTWAQSKKISITGTVTGGTTNNAATGAPVITGTPEVGELLTADISNIDDSDGIADADFEYQWIAFDGTTDSDIDGATGETYRPLLAHVGQTIKVRVSFDDDDDNAESLTSAPTATVIASTYGNVIYSAAMTVGEAEVFPGEPILGVYLGYLEGSLGSLEPLVFSFEGTAYTVTRIRSEVSLFGTSLAVHFVRDPEPYPGSGDGPVGPGFKLYLDGTKFNLTPERITNFFSHSLSWSDGQTVQVRLVPNQAPVGAPTISGTPAVGQTLTADTSAISDPDGPASLTFSYQWIANAGGADESEIAGETGATYTATVADLGTTISVRVGYTDAEGFEESLTSAAVAVVPAGLWLNATLTAGQIMDAGSPNGEIGYVGTPTGTVSGGSLSPTMFTAAGNSHTVESLIFDPDLGSGGGLALQVTGELPDDFSLGVGSERFAEADSTSLNLGIVSLYVWPPTPAVLGWSVGDEIAVWLAPPNTPATGLPTIGGTVQVGEPLTAGTSAIVDSNGLGGPFSYQWIRSDGTTDTEIEGATAATYTPVFAGEGQFLKVRVSFTDNGGNAEVLTSAATIAVAASPYGAVIWAGTMTVELWNAGGSDYLGWGRVPFGTPRGDLDQHTFVYDGVTQRWHLIYHQVAGANPGLRLIWEDSFAAVTTGRFNFWAHDDTAFTFDRETVTGSDIVLPVVTGEIDWYDFVTQPLQLRLTVDRVGAGDVLVSGTVAVDATVTADVSGLTDPDGVPAASEMSYQWLYGTGADPTTYALSTGETGSTYTVEAVHAQFSRRLAVRVSFTDGAGFEQTVYSARTGIVTDAAVTNAAPVFTDGASTARSVAENTAASSNVGSAVTATDADGDTLTYSLGGTDAASFDITSTSGQIQTSAALDYEQKTSYSVTVSVADGEGGTDTIGVTINVTDVNEKPDAPGAPTVTATSNTTTSLDVSWTAPGLNGGPALTGYEVRYRISGSWIDWTHSGTGTSATITGLTASTTYDVQVRALNGETPSDWSSTGTGSTGTPANNAPEFSDGASTARSVAENTAASSNVGSAVTATDADGDTLTYSLGGTDAASFSIVGASGQIQTSAALDYEQKTSYSVTVSVADGEGGTDTIGVTISVTDVNEKPATPGAPTVAATSNTTTSLDVSWTAPGLNGGPALTGYEVRYRISGSWIDWTHSGTGTSATITGLTASTTYDVQVRALNGETPSDWSSTGTGSTGTPANNAPEFSDGASTARSVAENTAASSNVGSAVTATDADGDTLTYSLGGTDAASFSIVGASGQIQTSAALDYEQKTSYSVTVSVADGEGGTDTIGVTISVTDVNEKPATPGAPTVAATSNTTTSLDVSWTAPGLNGGPALTGYEVRYRISGSWIDWTHSGTGTSATITGLTASTTYDVQVRALNGETPSDWSSTGTGSTGTPANNAPEFSDGASTARSVAENTAASSNVGSAVTATDADGDTLTYSLGGTDAASFSIVGASGQIQTSAALDYEQKTSYSVTVSVADGEGGTDTIGVTISVTDVNEKPATPGAPTVAATSNTTTSLDVSWTAPGLNGGPALTGYEVRYRISGSWIDWTHSGTGTSATITGLTASTTYDVQVRALNGETPSDWSSTGTGSTGTPANNAPEFSDGASTARSVAENTAASSNVGSAVTATDADGDTLTYSLGGTDAASFSIVGASGQIQTSAALDYEQKTSYSVTVSVADGEGGTDTIGVTISVTDVNEKPATPGAPTVAATSNTTTSLDVSWTAPGLNGGPALTGYEVRYRISGSWIDWTHSGTGTSATITGLTASTTYDVQVRALNGETPSDWSSTGTGSTGTPANNAPEFSDGASTARSVAENTAASSNVGSAVTATDADGDTLTYSLGGTDAASFSIVGASGQIQTSAALDYEQKTSYSVTVSVADGEGGTDTIGVTISVTDVNEKPATPGAPTVAATSNTTTSLDVSWTAPGLNGGPALTGYEVRYRISGSWIDWTHSGTGTSATITGLTASTTYDVQVRALNGETPSDWSSTGTGSTGGTPREGPHVSLVKVKEPVSCNVSWIALQFANLDMATEYHAHLRFRVQGSSSWTVLWPQGFWSSGIPGLAAGGALNGPSPTFTLPFLDYDTTYDVQVALDGGFVDGLATTTFSTPDLSEVGLAPLSPGDGTLGLRMTRPTSEGRVVGYLLQWKSGDEEYDDTDTSERQADVPGSGDREYTITGLDNGVEYTVRAMAYNDNGVGVPSSEVRGTPEAPPNSPARGAPTISGTAQVGETLTADTDGIEDDDGLADAVYSYQWLADDADIAGATNYTYTPVADDVGKAIKVKVSFRDDRNHQESLTSAATAAVEADPDAPTEPPNAPRTVRIVGDTNTSLTLTWDAPDGGTAVTEYRVQWLTVGENFGTARGDGREAVLGASARSHTITGLTEYKFYQVRVLAVNGAGESEGSNTAWCITGLGEGQYGHG